MTDELGQLLDGQSDAPRAVEVAELRDRSEHADREQVGIVPVGHEARGLSLGHDPRRVADVDVAALPQRGRDHLVAALHLEQGEEAHVLGHEAHGRLGPLTEAGHRVGVGVHRRRLRPAELLAHGPDQFGEQRLLRLEVPVEEALGDAGGLADVGDPGRAVAAAAEERFGRVEQLLLALQALVGVPSSTAVHALSPSAD